VSRIAWRTFCSTSTMGIPSRASCPISRNSSSTIIGASPSVCSSISSRRSAPASTRAIASICCSPPGCVPDTASDRGAGLLDNEAGKDAPILRHQPDPAPADPVRAHATQALALEHHLAPRRRYPPGDGLDHRGLSYAIAPEKPDDLALADA